MVPRAIQGSARPTLRRPREGGRAKLRFMGQEQGMQSPGPPHCVPIPTH